MAEQEALKESSLLTRHRKGSEFDAQMSKVFAIAGDEVTGSAEAMDKLRAKALEMGSTTQFTAT